MSVPSSHDGQIATTAPGSNERDRDADNAIDRTVASRFLVLQEVAHGGMGVVYRAEDRSSGEIVALKLAHSALSEQYKLRFLMEGQTLSRMRHTNIVHYVAHGLDDDGTPYVAMSWLRGIDLNALLRRRSLSEAETLAVGKQVCAALAALHRQGIVHRDVKTSNLMAVDGRVDQLRLIDFGLAYALGDRVESSQPGVIMGTPRFISPEQAQGLADMDTRTDLYSLGAVLFTCITGKPPFSGAQVVAVLAKLLLEPAPRVRQLRADVSLEFDQLIARLLAKEPGDRPNSAAEVLAALEEIEDGPSSPPVAVSRPRTRSLSHTERRFFSVLVIDHLPQREEPVLREALVDSGAGADATIHHLANGSVLVVFSTDSSPTEMATWAARCALFVHQRATRSHVVVATGLGALGHRAPVGEVVDRAVRFLTVYDSTARLDGEGVEEAPPDAFVDDVTAGLIEKRFHLQRHMGGCYILDSEVHRPYVEHRLLGRRIACVGRQRELEWLRSAFDECESDSCALAILVTGVAGSGKSRVMYEFVNRLQARADPPAIWIAYGASARQESPFAMLGQLIRQAVGIVGAEPLDVRRRSLQRHVADRFTVERAAHMAAFLGELCGTPFADDDLVRLREARRDPLLMHDLLRDAWEEWLDAETRARPVLCILEDVHWADSPSVRFVTETVRNRENQPFMALALARPGIQERFPKLLATPGLQYLPLGPLSKRACEQIVRRFSSGDLSSHTIARLVQRCDGNPYYLEELLRRTLTEGLDGLPDTVLALVGARMLTLSPGERRVLRAASVFGREFWLEGVAELLDLDVDVVRDRLMALIKEEFVAPLAPSRYAGRHAYTFRHALVREAAYAALTIDDQVRAHLGAGRWLESAGESEPMVLAEHYDRGGSPREAGLWYHRAAEQSMGADEMQDVIDRAERAAACGADDESLGRLRLLQAEARNWTSEPKSALTAAKQAMTLLPRGSDRWAQAAHQLAWASFALGELDELEQVADALIHHIDDEPSDIYLSAMAPCVANLRASGHEREAGACREVLYRHLETRRPGLMLQGIVARMEGILASFASDWSETAACMTRAVDAWKQLGSTRAACNDESNLAAALCELGRYDEGIRVLLDSQALAKRIGLTHVSLYCTVTLAITLARHGDIARSDDTFVTLHTMTKDKYVEALCHVYRAHAHLLAERHELVDEPIRESLTICGPDTLDHVFVYAMAVRTLGYLALSRERDALEAAIAGKACLERLGQVEEGDMLLRLAHAEALYANGEHEAAYRAIDDAHQRLRTRADGIRDPQWQESFLNDIQEHQRILRLVHEWRSS